MTFEAALTIQQDERAVTVRLAGDLDILTVARLNEVLRRAEGLSVSSIVLDLRDLAFIDSSGLHAIVQADTRTRRAGRRLTIVRGNDFVHRVFAVTELDRRLEIVDDPSAVTPVLDAAPMPDESP